MKTSTMCLAVAALSVFCGSAAAAGEDLENCLFRNGSSIPRNACERLRDKAAIAERERISDEAAQQRERDLRAAERERQLAGEERARIERRRREAEEQTRKEQWDQEQKAMRRAEAAQARAAADRETVRKQACGGDYKKVRIGMSIERAQQCVASFRLTAQVNRADAIVSTYEGGGGILQVIDGKIVAWAR